MCSWSWSSCVKPMQHALRTHLCSTPQHTWATGVWACMHANTPVDGAALGIQSLAICKASTVTCEPTHTHTHNRATTAQTQTVLTATPTASLTLRCRQGVCCDAGRADPRVSCASCLFAHECAAALCASMSISPIHPRVHIHNSSDLTVLGVLAFDISHIPSWTSSRRRRHRSACTAHRSCGGLGCRTACRCAGALRRCDLL